MSLVLKADNDIEGIDIGTYNLKIMQYADDTVLYLKNKKSLRNSFKLLDHFHKCAGLKLNREKTEAIELGIKWVEGSTKTLGL